MRAPEESIRHRDRWSWGTASRLEPVLRTPTVRLQMSAADHCVQRGKDLLVRQIAGGPEQDQDVRARRGHLGYPSS